MRLSAEEGRGRLTSARVARLASVRPDGAPHLVPVTFVVLDDVVSIAVDHKPKSTTALQRLANIAAEPRVALLADEFAEDWARLWWVRADAEAVVVDQLPELSIAALQAKYAQYVEQPPKGTGVLARVRSYTGWAARDARPA